MKPDSKKIASGITSGTVTSSTEQTSKSNKLSFKNNPGLSRRHLIIFALVFGIIGGFAIYKSFAAAPLVALVESENMVLPTTPSTGASNPATTVAASTATKTIDGNLSESDWNSVVPVTKTVLGTNTNTTTFSTLWDSNNLYVGVKVLDSSLKKDSAYVWEDDSLEIYVDANANGGTTYDAYDRQFTKGWNNSTLSEIRGKTTGVVHGWTAIPGGYSVELAIPWSNLGVTPSAGKAIKVDIGVNDDDNGGNRESQTMWSGTIDNYKNPSGFGSLSLGASVVNNPSITTPNAQVISDTSASNGKAVVLNTNTSLTSQFTTSSAATSLTVVAKSIVCSGVGSNMVVKIDNNQVAAPSVSATPWTAYTATINLAAGNHTLSISLTNDSNLNGCDRNLYVDKTEFFGVATTTTPAPTLSLSASPSSVTAGAASTLTWNSTNATSCTASGSWSGTKATTGSSSTGALNQNSTYSLSCNGSGGSASATTTVTVTTVAPPPTSGTTNLMYGVVAGPGTLSMPGVQSIGAKIARSTDVSYNATPASRESYILDAAKRGIEVILLIGFDAAPPDGGTAGDMAARFGPGGSFWQAGQPGAGYGQYAVRYIEWGNENSYNYGSKPGPTGGGAYANSFRSAYDRVQAKNPSVKLLAQGEDGGNGGSVWMDGMFSAQPNMKTMSACWVVHPYGPNGADKIDRMVNLLNAKGVSTSVPICITEDGISTDNGRCLNNNYGYDVCMSYDTAGTTLTNKVASLKAKSFGPRLLMYIQYKMLDDRSTGATIERENYFGIQKIDGTSKGNYTQAAKNLATQYPAH